MTVLSNAPYSLDRKRIPTAATPYELLARCVRHGLDTAVGIIAQDREDLQGYLTHKKTPPPRTLQ